MPSNSHPSMSWPRPQRGFTLVELLTAIAIFAILAAIALPNFTEMIQNQRARGAASDLFGTLLYARSEAIKRNTTVIVSRSGATWDAGWAVTVSGNTLKRQEPYKSVTIAGQAGGSVSFGSNGRPLAGFATNDPFIAYVTSRPAAFGRCVTLTLSGMPSVIDDPDTDRSNGC